jgi:hypothetical protein
MRHTITLVGFALSLLSACSQSEFAAPTDASSATTDDGGQNVDSITPLTGYPPGEEGSGSLSEDEGKICGDVQEGFGGKLFQLPANTSRLPDFKTMTPIAQIDAPTLNVAARKFTSGFPGIPNLIEWFGIRFYGFFTVENDATYTFRTLSDDGSKIFINDALVLSNDGIHGPSSMSASRLLKKGTYKIAVEWFQGPREQIALQVFWNTGSGETIIPLSAIKHSDLCDVANAGTFGQ